MRDEHLLRMEALAYSGRGGVAVELGKRRLARLPWFLRPQGHRDLASLHVTFGQWQDAATHSRQGMDLWGAIKYSALAGIPQAATLAYTSAQEPGIETIQSLFLWACTNGLRQIPLVFANNYIHLLPDSAVAVAAKVFVLAYPGDVDTPDRPFAQKGLESNASVNELIAQNRRLYSYLVTNPHKVPGGLPSISRRRERVELSAAAQAEFKPENLASTSSASDPCDWEDPKDVHQFVERLISAGHELTAAQTLSLYVSHMSFSGHRLAAALLAYGEPELAWSVIKAAESRSMLREPAEDKKLAAIWECGVNIGEVSPNLDSRISHSYPRLMQDIEASFGAHATLDSARQCWGASSRARTVSAWRFQKDKVRPFDPVWTEADIEAAQRPAAQPSGGLRDIVDEAVAGRWEEAGRRLDAVAVSSPWLAADAFLAKVDLQILRGRAEDAVAQLLAPQAKVQILHAILPILSAFDIEPRAEHVFRMHRWSLGQVRGWQIGQIGPVAFAEIDKAILAYVAARGRGLLASNRVAAPSDVSRILLISHVSAAAIHAPGAVQPPAANTKWVGSTFQDEMQEIMELAWSKIEATVKLPAPPKRRW